MKLRHYQGKIYRIQEFLEFQLQKNFKRDTVEFSHFSKLNIRQYRGGVYPKKVATTAKEWIQLKSDNPIEVPTEPTAPAKRSNKGEEGRKAEFDSFLLKSFENDRLYFDKANNKALGVFRELLKQKKPFIDSKTTRENFFNIFKNKKISAKNRVVWLGTNKELQLFVKLLNYNLKLIVDLKNDIWVTTPKCFVKRNGQSFKEAQLKNASGKNTKRYKTLEDILSGLQ